MSRETREYCDLCERDLTFLVGESIYRGRYQRFFHWKGTNNPRGEVTICNDCWNRLARELREARAVHSAEAPEADREKVA